MRATIQTIDFKILNWIQMNMKSSAMDDLMPMVTTLGDGGILWLIIAVLLLRTARYRAGGLALLCVLIVCFLCGNLMLKNIAGRSRPCDLVPDYPLLIARPHDYSFPSGHTLSSFAAAMVIFSIRPLWGMAAFVVASLIAFSRLYLYVHFPSDVLAGMVMGIAAAWGPVLTLTRY